MTSPLSFSRSLLLLFAFLLLTASATAPGQEILAEAAAEVEAAAEAVAEAASEVLSQAGQALDEAEIPSATESADEGILGGVNKALNQYFGKAADFIFDYLFVSIVPESWGSLPLIVAVLAFGAVFFTIWFGFINLWGLRHALDVVRGKYDDPNDEGEVSHFRALTSALSATVGLGNIAGVALAIGVGGPGAVFWMTLAGFFGMTAKFVECTLGHMYRVVNPDGTISGGPMYYLSRGLAARGGVFKPIGKVLAFLAAVIVMGAAIGGGNMFQGNQSWAALSYTLNLDADSPVAASAFGLAMVVGVGVVIIGGIRRIGAATARIVPIMAAIYVLGASIVIVRHIDAVPGAIMTILRTAFTNEGVAGGFLGILVMGVRRAAFSSEAGLGSASIAHAAAKTKEPVREGFVALLEPFIDTVIICNITALVIIVTGVYQPEIAETIPGGFFGGVVMTKVAFESVIPWFPWVLTACVILFAYSTMIAWCYYGERGWIYLLDHFGEGTGVRTVLAFRLVFLFFVYVGVIAGLDAVVDFADAMLLSMAFPNILGCILLLPVLTLAVKDYWKRYKGGEMMPLHSATLVRQLTGKDDKQIEGTKE